MSIAYEAGVKVLKIIFTIGGHVMKVNKISADKINTLGWI